MTDMIYRDESYTLMSYKVQVWKIEITNINFAHVENECVYVPKYVGSYKTKHTSV